MEGRSIEGKSGEERLASIPEWRLLLQVIPDIAGLINRVISDRPDEASVQEFFSLCRKIARTHLLVRSRAARSYQNIFGLEMDDLATDAVAELFQRNAVGVFVQVRSYFESIEMEELSTPAVLAHLRRLVCSKVNNHLMTLHAEHDPSFWKILRNCKLAIQTLRTFSVHERFGEIWIAPASVDPLLQKPPMDQTEIERLLWQSSRLNENIPTLLSCLSRALREQEQSTRMVRLYAVVAAIRAMYIRKNEADAMEDVVDQHLSPGEIAAIVEEACRNIHQHMAPQYLNRKGVAGKTYDHYFTAIRQHLHDKYISRDGFGKSLYEYLQAEQPDLQRDEYQADHRPRMEYLLRLVEMEAIRRLRREFH
jgi:hypothetical protein